MPVGAVEVDKFSLAVKVTLISSPAFAYEASSVLTEAILTEAILKPIERQTRGDQMQVASILRDLGLVKKRRGEKTSRKWVYIRDSDRVLTSV